ncbi:MAG: hypothetical protein AB1405_14965 [Bdellovibrionota bacterium]
MKGKPNGTGAGRVFGVLALKPVPTNLQFAVEDVSAHRFFDCTNYDECLDIAVRKKWPNFTCQECPIWAFHKQRQQAEEEARAEGSGEEK